MTPKQIERIKNKIKKIKRALAADKKRFGGFHHDGQGFRYMLPEQYLKIPDYTGALRYFNWFNKNFPDDRGFPIFLFEWTITLFKTKRIKLAENKAIETFFQTPTYSIPFLTKQSLNLTYLKGPIGKRKTWRSIFIIQKIRKSSLTSQSGWKNL